MTFGSLEAGLKLDDFSWLPLGTPDPAPRLVEGNAMLFGLHSKILRPRLDLQTLSTFDLQAPNTLRLCTRHLTHWKTGTAAEDLRSRAPKGPADLKGGIFESNERR